LKNRNAIMNADIAHRRTVVESPMVGLDERWSALVDGEVSSAELDALLQELEHDEQGQSACAEYRLIGDLVRGSVDTPTTAPHAFVSGVRARLAAQVEPHAQVVSLPAAAPAANDAVFRWKLVAGFASLAAVMAVSWSLLGVVSTTSAPAGMQLAQVQPAGQPALAQPSAAVLVNTEQGPVIRDARLEELLAEHRQYGGVSALQMPAGFLRDATYQTVPQR
jgi:sigma-E factor negative regulatory protein RseA